MPIGDLIFQKPLIMGVLNVTTDSFYDGGAYISLDKASDHAFELINQGVDIIDIGGESTRPGAQPVSLEVELERVIPIIEYIRKYSDICISIDSYKPQTMQTAVRAGASIINDVYALQKEGSVEMAAKLNVPVCLMHMQNRPDTMQDCPSYPEGLMNELSYFFMQRIEACKTAGIKMKNIILDPGFGFGKAVKDNLHIVYNLQKLQEFNLPLLLGVSRKSTIGVVLNKPVNERLAGSLAMAVFAALNGVGILRTHDVDETKQAIQVLDAIHQAA